jgi:hypothetical protein
MCFSAMATSADVGGRWQESRLPGFGARRRGKAADPRSRKRDTTESRSVQRTRASARVSEIAGYSRWLFKLSPRSPGRENGREAVRSPLILSAVSFSAGSRFSWIDSIE